MPVSENVLFWVKSLDESRTYELREELKSGEFVTHGEYFTKPELVRYVTSTWIDSAPPEYVICGR